MKFYGRNPKRDPKDDAFFWFKTYIPHSLGEILTLKSQSAGLPVSRLIAFCVDNEVTESAAPFHYDVALPESPFVEFAYAAEAAKLADFMRKFPQGVGRDSLMLCRRDIGIPDRDTFLLAYRELLRMGIIEEYEPRNTHFKHHAGYLYARIKDRETPSKNQFKRIEGKSTRKNAKALRRRFEKGENNE